LRRRVPIALLSLLAVLPGTARAEEAETARPGTGPLLDRVSRHVVTLLVKFQKDLEAEATGAVAPDPESISERFRFWRMSYLVPGFVVRDRRTVIASDLWMPPGSIASITIKPLEGGEVPGRLRGFLHRGQGLVIEAEGDLPVEPVPFPERVTVTIDTPLFAGSVMESTDGLEAWVDGIGGMRRRPVGRKGFAYGDPDRPDEALEGTAGGMMRTVDLVMDAKGTPLGFRFGGPLDLGADLWMGPDVLEDREVPFSSLREMALGLASGSSAHRVKVNFRTASRHDRDGNPFGNEEGNPEAEFWGLAVRPDALLAIGRLEDGEIRRIESVRIQDDDDGPGIEASFGGRLRGYDAFVVHVPAGGLAPLPPLAPPPPVIGEAFLVHRVAWRGGARRDQVDYDRMTGWARSYGDRRFLAAEQRIEEGAILMDLDGGVFGFAARLNPEDREKPLGEGRQRGRPTYNQVAVLFCQEGLPATLVEDPDTQVMPAEETEAKRTPWLGVEFDGISDGVAELMEVSEATRDGSRGLVVTLVYPDSPAARAGIQEGDILLSVKRTSGPGADAPPVDLRDAGNDFFGGGFPFPFGGGGGQAPWRPVTNALVRLLQSWGVGSPYELEYLRDGNLMKASLTAELGPPDFSSAPRAKDEPTGLSVRDLTYEVKAALRMPAAATGVVIARVEPGSPAAQARIDDNELILEYDGKPVEGAEALRRTLERDREAGKMTARLVVRRLGKTRLVDLCLAPQECPPGTEGAPPGEDVPEEGSVEGE
jgi:hypothetical protein